MKVKFTVEYSAEARADQLRILAFLVAKAVEVAGDEDEPDFEHCEDVVRAIEVEVQSSLRHWPLKYPRAGKEPLIRILKMSNGYRAIYEVFPERGMIIVAGIENQRELGRYGL